MKNRYFLSVNHTPNPLSVRPLSVRGAAGQLAGRGATAEGERSVERAGPAARGSGR